METGTFESAFGYDLATYRWQVDDPKFIFYLSHGYGEYTASKAYTREFIGRVQKLGGAVYGHDHFAHGESGPYAKDHAERCLVKNFQESAEDLKKRLQDFLAGHSMGGLISLIAIEAEQNRPDIQGLLLLSAAIKIHPDAGPGWLLALAKIAGCFTPWIKPPRTFGVETVTRNKENYSWLEEQGKEYGDNGGPNLGFISRMLTAQNDFQKWLKSGKFPKNIPTFIATGTDDFITDIAGSSLAAENINDSKLFKYEGAYHALHNELPEVTNRFYEDMTSWIENQLKKHSQKSQK
ncbi:unnamed protein product [Oikopleura dioica]|uniref:Serine aminopeptidase S33 domain-containing protein n=1 Tax=Oikopleura dioica TaxID=34765 RepID=E4YNK7_OIKDI|nr:unnamed protein product [Oikopleura dioica]